jgi:hypothetical protein
MKNKLSLAFAGAAMFAAVAFTGFTTSGSSIDELTSKADSISYCTPTANSDCHSSATGNIYAGYKAATKEVPEVLGDN